MIGIGERSQVLIDALPYIREYHDKVVGVKYGGNAMTDDALKDSVMGDIVLLSLIGVKVVLVHGGGPEIDDMLKRLGIERRFIGGLRRTDAETVEIVNMVLSGKVNKELVKSLALHKGKALGVSGLDGGMISARKMEGDPDLGFVGEIEAVDTKPIVDIINAGYIPVIATVGRDADGQIYNINADTAAARIAACLRAANLILMTDTAGLLRDRDDPSTLISRLSVSEVPLLKRQGVISGGMLPKIDCCVESLRRGVAKTCIIDGRVEHALLIELLTSEGVGTQFC
jgi:acetylglutamate kinase